MDRNVLMMNDWDLEGTVELCSNPVTSRHGDMVYFKYRGPKLRVQVPESYLRYSPTKYDTLTVDLPDSACEKLKAFDDRIVHQIARRNGYGLLGRSVTDAEVRKAYRSVLRESEGSTSFAARNCRYFNKNLERIVKEQVKEDSFVIIVMQPGWLFFKEGQITCTLLALDCLVTKTDDDSECLVHLETQDEIM